MATQSEVMELVAKVVDQYSGPLKDMQRSFTELNRSIKGGHEAAGKGAREHAERVKEMRERYNQLKETVSGAVVPALTSLGVTVFSVGGALSEMVEAIKDASEHYRALQLTMARGGSGVTQQFTEVYERAFERLGFTAAQADDAIGKMGHSFTMMGRLNAAEMQRLQRTAPDMLIWINKITAGAHSNAEAMLMLTKAVADNAGEIPEYMREKIARAFNIPLAMASRKGSEVGKAFREGIADEMAHPAPSLPLLDQISHSMDDLSQKFRNYKNEIVNTFGPEMLAIINAFSAALEKLSNILKAGRESLDRSSLLGRLMRGPASPNERVGEEFGALSTMQGRLDFFPVRPGPGQTGTYFGGNNRMPLPRGWLGAIGAAAAAAGQQTPAQQFAAGMLPVSFGGFGQTGGRGGAEDTIYRAMYRALSDWYQSLLGTAGVTNAAFGGGGATGGWGGGGYHVVPEGGPATGGGGAGHRGGSEGQEESGPPATAADMGPLGSLIGGTVAGRFAEGRLRAIQELKNKPWLKEKLFQVAAGEDRPRAGPSGQAFQSVLEETVNRAVLRGTSVEHEARFTREGGYYAGVPSHLSTTERQYAERALKDVLEGKSNLSGYATDNSSGALAARETRTGAFIPTSRYHGESFFGPGRAERVLSKRWRRYVEEAKRAKAEGKDIGSRLKLDFYNYPRAELERQGDEGARALYPSERVQDVFEALQGGKGFGAMNLSESQRSSVLRERIRQYGERMKKAQADQLKVHGQASVRIDLNGAPRGTRATASSNGIFKEVALHRGAVMPMASQLA